MPLAIPGALACIAAVTAGILIYAARPRQLQNRLLAILLPLEAIAMGAFAAASVISDPDLAEDVLALNLAAAAFVPWFYFALLGTLDSPLSRPFASRTARVLLYAVVGLLYTAFLFARPVFLPGVEPAETVPWRVQLAPAQQAVLTFLGLVMFFGLAVAFSAYRRAPRGTVARRQAGAFLLAFGVRDVISGVLLVGQIAVPRGAATEIAIVVGFSLSTLLFVVLLGYGILKSQLFDIDIKIRRGIARGTATLVFAAAFLVVAEAAQQFVSDAFGYLAGGLVALLLLFALRPIDAFARRFATAVTPGARALSDLAIDERRGLYLEQARAAWADGTLTMGERRVLDVARERLGLPAEEALALERAAMTRETTA